MAPITPGKPKRSRTGKRIIDTKRLDNFLASLNVGVKPSVHINGPSFVTALVCVDFGSPLVQARLSQDESAVLSDHLREVARDILSGREATIRINHDGPNGVYWASIT